MPVDPSSLHTITPYFDLTRQSPVHVLLVLRNNPVIKLNFFGLFPNMIRTNEIAKSLSITTLPLQQ